MDVGIIVGQIRVFGHGLELGCPAVVVGKHSRERGLAAAYVSCDGDMHVSVGKEAGVAACLFVDSWAAKVMFYFDISYFSTTFVAQK